jgi:hypothetical protein
MVRCGFKELVHIIVVLVSLESWISWRQQAGVIVMSVGKVSSPGSQLLLFRPSTDRMRYIQLPKTVTFT